VRIGLVIERVDAWRGGAETSTWQFINHLVAKGVELVLFTRSRPASFPGCEVRHIRTPAGLRSWASAEFLRRAARACGQAGVDLVHAINPCYAADVYEPRGGTIIETMLRNVALRRTGIGRAVKSTLSQLNQKQRVLLRAERRLLRRDPGPIVVAISRYVQRQLEEHYGLSRDRVRLIFNGVDPVDCPPDVRRSNRREIRALFSIPERAYVLLLVAHNFKLKGLAQAIDALARLDGSGERDPILVIVGRGGPARCRRQAERLGVLNRLRFVGETDRTQAFYHAADVLVHPTFYDPCSRVVLEALSAGLPCVTTRFNGAAEIMTDAQHGFILDSPRDIDGLVKALERLGDEEFRQRCGEAAAGLRERLSMKRHALQMRALYEELLERKRK
jgi:UDP-glucose:(heptosyl)LPS alpha-1,3-glucosyltransferase